VFPVVETAPQQTVVDSGGDSEVAVNGAITERVLDRPLERRHASPVVGRYARHKGGTVRDTYGPVVCVEGRPPEPVDAWTPLVWTQVSGSYFHAMGIPLLRGRYFNSQDRPESPPVVIVNETLARRYWPREDPIGKRLKGMDPRGRNDDWLTVVGLVKDTRSGGLWARHDRRTVQLAFTNRAVRETRSKRGAGMSLQRLTTVRGLGPPTASSKRVHSQRRIKIMNRLNWRIFTVAVALAIAATTASAQVTLKAQVPFSFTAGSDRVLQPGNYSLSGTSSVWYIRSYDTHQTALAMPRAATRSIRGGTPKLVFHCRTRGCSLYAIEKGTGDGVMFGEPRRSKADADELARVVVVPLTASNAD
jgi:hypothetical protein